MRYYRSSGHVFTITCFSSDQANKLGNESYVRPLWDLCDDLDLSTETVVSEYSVDAEFNTLYVVL